MQLPICVECQNHVRLWYKYNSKGPVLLQEAHAFVFFINFQVIRKHTRLRATHLVDGTSKE